MSVLRALFFDIGDTLVFDNPSVDKRFYRAAQQVGLLFDSDLLPEMFRALEQCSLTAYLTGIPIDNPDLMRESTNVALKVVGIAPPTDTLWQNLATAYQEIPFQRVVASGVPALLTALRQRGFTLGAISDWDNELPNLLVEWSLAPLFDTVAVSALVGCTKPDPRLFQAALSQANVCPEESLHVGDWYELDVAGARAAGMQPLLYDWKGRRPNADCPRVTTFDQLAAYLTKYA